MGNGNLKSHVDMAATGLPQLLIVRLRCELRKAQVFAPMVSMTGHYLISNQH